MTDVGNPAWRAELRALADAATPGPWLGIYWDENVTFGQPWWLVECNPPDVLTVARVYPGTLGNEPADAAFIAASREAVPALLGAYERLLADLREAQQNLIDFGRHDLDCQLRMEHYAQPCRPSWARAATAAS